MIMGPAFDVLLSFLVMAKEQDGINKAVAVILAAAVVVVLPQE